MLWLFWFVVSMSRRKQAFPVRIEGSRLHLSVDPGSPSTEKPEDPSSTAIQLDVHDLSTGDEAADSKPPEILPNGEFVATDTVNNEWKTNIFACEEENYHKSKTKPQVALPSAKVELQDISVQVDVSVALDKEHDPLNFSACNNSCTVAENNCSNFSADEKKQCENSVCDPEVEGSSEICRDFNVRTSLMCKTGTEIKLVHNISAQKVEVQCVTNSTENAFGIHKKQLKQGRGSPHKNIVPEDKNQMPAYANEKPAESKGSLPLDVILPCAEVDPFLLKEESEPLIISPSTDLIPTAEDTNLSPFCDGEIGQCERVIGTLEHDSNTILLDEHDLNVPIGAIHAGSPNNSEFVLTPTVYDETKDVVTYNKENILQDEIDIQLILPSDKLEPLEPSVILSEGQGSVIISPCSETSCVKNECFFPFPDGEEEQCEGITSTQQLKPVCLFHAHVPCDCEGAVQSVKMCRDLNVQVPLKCEDGTGTKNIGSLFIEKEEEESAVRFTEGSFAVGKEQLQKIREPLHENHVLQPTEQRRVCSEQELSPDSEGSPLQAILPCVGIDPLLLKEEPESLIISPSPDSFPVVEENSISSFSVGEGTIDVPELKLMCLTHSHGQCDCKKVTQNTVIGDDLNGEPESKTEFTKSARTGKKKVRGGRKSKGKSSKARRKRTQKSRSFRKSRTSMTLKQSKARPKHENLLQEILPCVDVDQSVLKREPESLMTSPSKDSVPIAAERNVFSFPDNEINQPESKSNTQKSIRMCLRTKLVKHDYEEIEEGIGLSDDSTISDSDVHIPGPKSSKSLQPCVTDEEIRCLVDDTKESLDVRQKKLQQIREAVYRKRALESDDQRRIRLEKDKLRQRRRRAEESDEQREKRLLTMRLHKRIKRSMHSSEELQKDFLDYYMEEMFKYPETQEEQGSPLNMIVSIDPSWVLRTVEKQQFKCAAETEEQRKVRLQKDMLRQRKKRAEESDEQRAKRLETMRINKRIRRAMETEEQRHRRLEYSRERQLYRRLNETEQQRKERLEREKLRQREKRATESSEERALRLQAARERMRMRLSGSGKDTDMFENLLSSDSLSS